MDRLPHSPRDDGTFDFYGTFLQAIKIEDLGIALTDPTEPIERLNAYMNLSDLAVDSVSQEVKRLAQEKIDLLKLLAGNT